jgi:hypothetical protein
MLKARPIWDIKANHGSPSVDSIILAGRQQPLNPSSLKTGYSVTCRSSTIRLGGVTGNGLCRNVAHVSPPCHPQQQTGVMGSLLCGQSVALLNSQKILGILKNEKRSASYG